VSEWVIVWVSDINGVSEWLRKIAWVSDGASVIYVCALAAALVELAVIVRASDLPSAEDDDDDVILVTRCHTMTSTTITDNHATI